MNVDTRFLEEELDDQNAEVRRQDVVEEPVAPGGCDLVHACALLMHLPAGDAVLADLGAAVRPGGWKAEILSTTFARSVKANSFVVGGQGSSVRPSL